MVGTAAAALSPANEAAHLNSNAIHGDVEATAVEDPPKKPHIIVVLTDDLGKGVMPRLVVGVLDNS